MSYPASYPMYAHIHRDPTGMRALPRIPPRLFADFDVVAGGPSSDADRQASEEMGEKYACKGATEAYFPLDVRAENDTGRIGRCHVLTVEMSLPCSALCSMLLPQYFPTWNFFQ